MLLSTGCAQMSPYARSQPDARSEGGEVYSTSVKNEAERVTAKSPTNAERDLRARTVSNDPVSPLQVRERDDARKPHTPVATVELTPREPDEKNALFQIPQPASAQEQTSELEPVVLAFHYIFIGKHQEAIKALRSYDEPTQEFMLRVLPLLTHITKSTLDKMSSQELDILNEQLKGVVSLLRTRCGLSVNKMVFCKSVNGFANYEPLPDDHAFLARTDKRPGDLVQLYVELKNFASKEAKEGEYLTKLACSLELKDINGEKVWAHTFDKSDTTHRRSACVNDYHGNFSFYVPALPAGTYQLTIQVVDETIPEHRRVARRSQVFRVTPVVNAASR